MKKQVFRKLYGFEAKTILKRDKRIAYASKKSRVSIEHIYINSTIIKGHFTFLDLSKESLLKLDEILLNYKEYSLYRIV